MNLATCGSNALQPSTLGSALNERVHFAHNLFMRNDFASTGFLQPDADVFEYARVAYSRSKARRAITQF
jgi:hypothetical protein